MEEKKDKKGLSASTKHILIGVSIGLVVAIICMAVYKKIYVEGSYEMKLYEIVEEYNDRMEEVFNTNDINNYTISSNWERRNIKITIKRNDIDYEEDCENGTIDELLDDVGTQYCYNLIEPVIEDLNEKDYEKFNLSYTVEIVDKYDKEILVHNYYPNVIQ